MTRFLIATIIAILWPFALHITSMKNIELSKISYTKFWPFHIASTIGALSALIGPSTISAVGASIWFLFSLYVAVRYFLLLLNSTNFYPVNIALHLAPAFVAFGSAWLVASNLEYNLLGFSSTIVLLTAAHFHAAGGCFILLTVLSGLEYKRRLNEYMSGFALVSIPATAIGIQFGGIPEGIGAAFTVLAGMAFALIQLFLSAPNKIKRVLRFASSFSVVVAMGFAFAFSLQHWGLNIELTIETMVLWHASLNTFGFIGLGLLSYSSLPERFWAT